MNTKYEDNKMLKMNDRVVSSFIIPAILILVLGNLLLTVIIFKKVYSNNKEVCIVNPGDVSSPFYFGTEKSVSKNWVLDGERKHLAFGNVCEGADGILYAVFRGGYQHGVALNPGNLNYNIGGALYYSISKDEGNTWSEPICFLQPEEYMDLRDPSLMYDSLMDCYFLTYTEIANDHSTYSIHLIKMPQDNGFCVFDDYVETDLPIQDMPVNNACYHQIVRIGSNLYLPFYGKDVEGGYYYSGLLKGNAFGTKWEVLYTWNEDEPDNSSECTFFTTFNDNGSLRYHMIFRGGNVDSSYPYDLDRAHYSYSDDGGVTWSNKICLGFDCAGGPRVFDINGTKILLCRDQSVGESGNGIGVCVAAFSKNGRDWTNKMLIADDGPGYASLICTEYGKGKVFYFKEYGHYSGLYCREINGIPKIN